VSLGVMVQVPWSRGEGAGTVRGRTALIRRFRLFLERVGVTWLSLAGRRMTSQKAGHQIA
jgi:hypothetical protein